jgi:hypothetical protein
MIKLMKNHSIAKGLEPGHIVFIGEDFAKVVL